MAAMRQMCEDYRPHVTENVQGIWLASSYLLPPSRTATVHGSSWPWGGEGMI